MNTGDRATGIRHIVVASAALMSVLLYLDRFCISFAEIYIQEDLGLTDAQVGWMLSAFFWTYALGQVPAGWLTDRFGSRIMLTAYVLFWSLFTGLTGAASVFAALLLLRLGFGFAQAGAYPTASSIVSKWVPFSRRATASSVIAFGGRVGGFLALFASGHLIVWLTPLDTPTSLSSSDIMNPALLCSRLSEVPTPDMPESRLRRKCFEQFSDSHRELVQRIAEGGEPTTAMQETVAAHASESPAVAAVLAEELTALIGTRGFFQPDDIKDVSVEKEAVRLMRRPQSELNDVESARLNRLVIEGLFRDSVKKLYVAGWRPMMFVYGGLGILVAALIWWSCRTTPAEHPWCNAAEASLINGRSPTKRDSGAVGRAPLGALVRSVSMWNSCVSQWFTNIGWVFLMTWAPRYLTSVHHLSTESRALLVSIPPLVGWAGMLSGGAFSDLCVERFGLRWGRASPISLSRFVAMFAYIGCLFEPSTALFAVAMFSVVAFATDFGSPATWAFTQDVGGRHVGSVLGWGNMWGNLGAAVTPPLLIWVIGPSANWKYAFLTCAGAFLLSGLFALGINATIPIAPEENEGELEA